MKRTPAQWMARNAARLAVLAADMADTHKLMNTAELGSRRYGALAANHRYVKAEFNDLERRHIAAGGQPWQPE